MTVSYSRCRVSSERKPASLITPHGKCSIERADNGGSAGTDSTTGTTSRSTQCEGIGGPAWPLFGGFRPAYRGCLGRRGSCRRRRLGRLPLRRCRRRRRRLSRLGHRRLLLCRRRGCRRRGRRRHVRRCLGRGLLRLLFGHVLHLQPPLGGKVVPLLVAVFVCDVVNTLAVFPPGLVDHSEEPAALSGPEDLDEAAKWDAELVVPLPSDIVVVGHLGGTSWRRVWRGWCVDQRARARARAANAWRASRAGNSTGDRRRLKRGSRE
eukprot:scaffold17544_cov63-Phaeocystis_antarctica.AAC.2